MNKLLPVTNYGFSRYVNNILEYVEKEYGVSYIFVNKPLGNCSIDVNNKLISIGMPKSLCGVDKSNKLSTSVLDVKHINHKHIMAITVGVFHEIGHLKLYGDALQTESYLACSDILTYPESSVYYHNKKNYAYNSCEILAEYDGIMSACEYMSMFYKNSDELILDYVNTKVDFDKDGYFIHRSVSSIDDITDAFDEAFEKSKFHRRMYNIYTRGLQNDEVLNFFDEQPRFRVKFDEEQDPLQQDKMVASVVLHYRPEIQDNYQCLKDVDMSVENVFEIPLRELPSVQIDDTSDDFEYN